MQHPQRLSVEELWAPAGVWQCWQCGGLAAICPGNILVDATHFKHAMEEEGVPKQPGRAGEHHGQKL
jgi:hypothetical protein